MGQLHVRFGGEGESGGRVPERRVSMKCWRQGCVWATALFVGGWREAARGEGVSERVCTDTDDRWCWLQCLGQWVNLMRVGGGGGLGMASSSPVNG